MSRIKRRKWSSKDFGILNKGGVFDLFDNTIKSTYRITDDEYDFLCVALSDEEFDIFLENKNLNFSHGRKVITLLNKYLYR